MIKIKLLVGKVIDGSVYFPDTIIEVEPDQAVALLNAHEAVPVEQDGDVETATAGPQA